MDTPLMHARGRDPEVAGTRTTIYDLVPYFLQPDWTEAAIAEVNRLTTEQVAAMRAHFLAHYAEVMAGHERIEQRNLSGMQEQASPEFRSRLWWNRERLDLFREWLRERGSSESSATEFRDWYEARNAVGVAG